MMKNDAKQNAIESIIVFEVFVAFHNFATLPSYCSLFLSRDLISCIDFTVIIDDVLINLFV